MNQEDAIYDAAAAAAQQDIQAQQARVGFALAADTDADAYAEARRVAQRTGVPVEAVLANPQASKRQDRVDAVDFDTLAKFNPVTAGILADVERARLVHDDVQQMSQFESLLRSAGRFVKGTAKAAATGVPRFNKGMYGALQYGAELLPESIGSGPAKFFAEQAQANQETIERWMPQGRNIYEQSWYSGIGSAGSNMVNLAAGAATGGMSLPFMGLQTAGDAYADARKQGVAPSTAAIFASGQGLVEVGTEMMSFGPLMDMFKPGAAFGKKLLEYTIKEHGGEQIATHLQDLNEWAVLHPDKTFGDYLRERPNAALQTALSTAFATGAQGGVIKGAQLAIGLAQGKQAQAQQSEQTVQFVQGMHEMSAASKVLQRDPETFAQFVEQAAEAGGVQQVYIDAQALMQTGVAQQVAEASPAVAAQLQQALQTGGQVAIPVGEYAATIAPTQYAQSLLDHLKIDPDDFSRAEAQEYMQNHSQQLQADMERLLAQQEGDDSFKASADVVRNEIKTQLDTAARFTPQVNDSYAALTSSFYAVQAARMGMTPEELYRQYPLRVMAQTPTFEAPALVTRGAYNQLVDISQDTDRGKQRIQALAEWAQKQLEKEGFTADLQHSGSTAGPSSYLDVTDLHTGSKLDRQLRFSGHSKGAYQHQFIHDLGSEAEVLALIEELKAQRTPERIEAYQAFLARAQAQQAQQNEARAQELARLMEVETQRLQRAEEKEAKGEPLSKMDRKVLKARDEGRLLRDGGSRYWQSTEAPFLAPEVRNEQGQLLAPNGQVSKLNERQWHQVRSPQFKAWFGDWENDPKNASKVVDENGEPLVVYHGTDADFTAFDPARSRAAQYGGKGFFFTASREVADRFGAKAMPVFLSAKTGLPEKRAARQAGIAINVDHIRPANDERDIWVVFSPNQIKSATDNNGAFDVDNPNILLQRSQETKAAYEARIDELFQDGAKANRVGARVLDRSDMLGLLGYADKPVLLAEGKVLAGRDNHPHMTADVWKKIPEWLDSPAAVFKSDTDEGLVFIAPETVAGSPVSMIVSLDTDGRNALNVHLLLNAYDRSSSTPFMRWINDGLLQYVDKKKFPALFDSVVGRRLPDTALQNKPGTNKILTEKNLAGYRKERGDVLFARQQPGITRGFFDPSSNTIGLLKDADLSTFLHEAGHFFLEMQVDLASRVQQEAGLFGADTNTEGREQIAQDMQILLDWFGVRDLAEWHNMDMEQKRSYHEQFARGFEAYLYEGKAPSIELQGLFQRFRAWLVNVYKSLRSLNVELSDDVRGVFDRMLASNEQIALAEQGRSMLPLFESAEQAGLTPEEFAAYQAQDTQATADAIQELQARGLRDMQWLHNARGREMKRLQKQAKALRNEAQMQVRSEVMRQPVYRAWQFLTNRMTEDALTSPSDNPQAQGAGRLGIVELNNMGLPVEVVEALKARKMTAKNGLHPDIVADLFGFTSGDEMVRKLAAATPMQEEIEALTDARMLEEHGELATPDAIARAADSAIHNEARARFVATEANALAKATGQRKVLASAAKEYAAAIISRLKVRNVRPNQYANAQARAAKLAEKAQRAGDLATAAAEKRNQLVQQYAARAAHDAREEIDAGLRYLKRFEGDIKNLDADYAEQIHGLLERFDLRKGQSLKAIDQRKSLAEWIKAQRDAGLSPDIAPEMENEAYRQSYKDMTVEEFRGLLDTVKQIEHMGRQEHKLLTSRAKQELAAVTDELVSSITQHAHGRKAVNRTPTTKMGRFWQKLRGIWASHIKIATQAFVMDGGKDGGPVWEYFIRTANERANRETTMRAEATQKLAAILKPVMDMGKMGGSGKYFESIGRSLNRGEIFAIALNLGNEGNMQRLLDGEGWTMQQLQPVINSLSAVEWHAVQQVWDLFESYRDQIAAKEKRVYGKEPQWVEPRPFTVATADGQTVEMRGGYYPIKYDTMASEQAESHSAAEAARQQLRGAYKMATTNRSFAKKRAQRVVGRPLLLTWDGLYSGLDNVIHDLNWHEWVIDASKLLRQPAIDRAIREHYGSEVNKQFSKWVDDIAKGDRTVAAPEQTILAALRKNVSMAGLGFNLISAAMQPLGLTQSIARIGPKWVGRGITKFISDPIGLARQINEMSSFMADRSSTRMRELNELRNQVQAQSDSKVVRKWNEFRDEYAYALMMRSQQLVDVPTWWGAYEKAIADGNDESRAIALADQAVIDSQGSGHLKDLSALERSPTARIFTVFYSFMNTALNLNAAQIMTARTPKQRARMAANLLWINVVPVVLGHALRAALIPGDSGDYEDPEKLAAALARAELEHLFGLFVVGREFGPVVADALFGEAVQGYQGPSGLRTIQDTAKFAQQAKQGEFDEAFLRASINLAGSTTGIPSAQANRFVKGASALSKGETENPAALAFGYQEPR